MQVIYLTRTVNILILRLQSLQCLTEYTLRSRRERDGALSSLNSVEAQHENVRD